ncbi:hypothetical protein EON80_23090 [bacterium]|nr:MAG: hypothetical protein EON80_23090 [bacterium]
MLIPTRSKTKIPHGWSYPVGAEVISTALAGVPQFESIHLRFLWMNPNSADARRYSDSLIHLMNVNYATPGGMDEQNWGVDVSAVPSPLKDRLKAEIAGPILQTARVWMMTERNALWYATSQSMAVWFDTNRETVVYSKEM